MFDEFSAIMETSNFMVLDTETTGLKAPAQVLQVAVISSCGQTMLDRIVIPVLPIPLEAVAVHGFNAEFCLANGSPWQAVKAELMHVIKGQNVVTYNAKYDRYMLHCTDDAFKLSATDYKEDTQWHCAMEWYAQVYGDYNAYYGSYRWQRLTTAMQQQGLPVLDAHNALGDCRMTLNLIRKLCQKKEPLKW